MRGDHPSSRFCLATWFCIPFSLTHLIVEITRYWHRLQKTGRGSERYQWEWCGKERREAGGFVADLRWSGSVATVVLRSLGQQCLTWQFSGIRPGWMVARCWLASD